MRWEPLDLFTVPAPAASKARLPSTRAKPTPRNTLEARPTSDKDRGNDARVLHQIKAAGSLGITRNELHEATGLSIQTLSWSIARLFARGQAFRREDHSRHDGKRRFVSRTRCYVIYADLYRSLFAASDCPPFEERAALRSA